MGRQKGQRNQYPRSKRKLQRSAKSRFNNGHGKKKLRGRERKGKICLLALLGKPGGVGGKKEKKIGEKKGALWNSTANWKGHPKIKTLGGGFEQESPGGTGERKRKGVT